MKEKNIHKGTHSQQEQQNYKLLEEYIPGSPYIRFVARAVKSQIRFSSVFITVLLLNCIAFSIAAEAQRNNRQNPAERFDEIHPYTGKFTANFFPEEFCRARFPAVNMPPNLRIGGKKGKMLPASCVKNEKSKECQNEFKLFSSHVSEAEAYEKMKNEITKLWEEWRDDLLNKIAKQRNTTPQNLSFVVTAAESEIITYLGVLKRSYLSAQYANNQKRGNCANQVSMAVVDGIGYAIQTDPNLKMQRIKVSSSYSGNRVKDHVFLLINSSEFDGIRIKGDKEKVREILKKINKNAIICDPWNNGYMENYSKDTTGLYKDMEWENLEVRNIKFDFRGYKNLDRFFRRLLCNELKAMNKPLFEFNDCANNLG